MGKLTFCYGKYPFLIGNIGKSTISMGLKIMNPVLNVKWMDATLVIEGFAMVYVNLGYFNPLVFWYQSDYLRSPALKEM